MTDDVINFAKLKEISTQIFHDQGSGNINNEIIRRYGGHEFTLSNSEAVVFTTNTRPTYDVDPKGNGGNYRLLETKIPKEVLMGIFDTDHDGKITVSERLNPDSAKKLISLTQKLEAQLKAHYASNPGDFKEVDPKSLEEQQSWKPADIIVDRAINKIDFSKLQ